MRVRVKVVAVGAMLALILTAAIVAVGTASSTRDVASAQEPPREDPQSQEQWFIRYDGIEGEASDPNHDKWIDVLSIDWGVHQATAGATGQSRRRGGVVVEDVTLTIEYEKASPKILEKVLVGEVIPKLDIELTSTYGGARATYLKYELKNVMITSYDVNGSADDGSPPAVTIGNNFEEIKVTYTEYDDATGGAKGNVETTWKVEKGEK